MSRRGQIGMSEDELSDFIAAQRTVQLAVNGPDGFPHLTTLWYGVLDGKIAVWTYAKSQKVKNLDRDPRVTALVELGDRYSELRGVMIRGRAVMSTEKADVMAVAQKVYAANADRFGDVTYRGGALDRESLDVLEAMSTKRIAVIVEPEDVVTWDHRKLGGSY